MKYLFIFNPHAANGRARKLLPALKTRMNHLEMDVDLVQTDARGHAKILVAEADLSRYKGIISAGGDGTLFEVINGYFANPSSERIPIGVLPVGTGNAFARDLDLKISDWEKALDIIRSGVTKRIDVGHFSSEGKEFYFLNILGLGFVSDVSETAQKLKVFGNTAYTLGVLYQLTFLKTHKLILEADGKRMERENIFVEISNTRYTGTSFLMAPKAQNDDGLLDITLLNKKSRLGILKIFPTIFDGTHVEKGGIETFTAKKIRIETEPNKVLTPDGEVLGHTPIEVDCLHRAVEMFWPKV